MHEVLRRWAVAHGIGAVTSDAAALRALLRAGVHALSDEVLDEGYAVLAESYSAAPDSDERRAARDRYVARTDAHQ